MILQILFWFSVASIDRSVQFDTIESLKNGFDLKHPFIISGAKDISFQRILKTFSNHGEYVSFKRSFINITERLKFKSNLIFIESNVKVIKTELDFLKKYEVRAFFLLDDSLFNFVFEKISMEINEEIFFIRKSTNEVFEKYNINGIQIRRKLGILTKEKVCWEIDIIPSFIRRRANFQGLTMKAFTESYGNEVMIDSKFKDNAPYFETNQTFLVNGHVSGLHLDILKLMEVSLNFTTELFKPKVQNWGFVKNVNGTLKGTGMVGGVFNKEADFVLSSMGLIYDER